MFGYIKIDKNELKVRDYNLFKSYYCGVCRALKKEYGFPCHYFLSYDVTFLAVFLDALSKNSPSHCQVRCMANPAIHRPAVERNEAVSYAAAVNVLLVWFKLKDDWADNHSLKAAFLMFLMRGRKNKAKKIFPLLYKKIHDRLCNLDAMEKEKCSQPDAVAAVFGKLMADIFDIEQIEDGDIRRVGSHVGFLLGRLIYLMDAWADREADKKAHAYNPFLLNEDISKEDVQLSLEYTLAELGNSLNLIPFNRNQDIIENIVYLGLRQEIDSVFSDKISQKKKGMKEKHHERPI